MKRWGALALMLGSCAQVELPPLSARVTIEETGEVIGSADVYGFSFGPRDNVLVDLDSGDRLYLTLYGDVANGTLVPFEGEPGVISSAPVEVSYQVLPTEPGVDVIFEPCQSDARSEGGLVLEGRSWNADGDIDGLAGTLRVRFVGCEETRGELDLGDVTFVVDFPE